MFGFFDGGVGEVVAEGVDGHGFFTENVFAGIDSGLEVNGAEAGRGGEKDDVDTGGDEFLVGVETDEAFVGVDGDAVGEFLREGVDGAVDLRGENIGDGDEFGVVVRAEGLGGSAGATATAADETDFEGFLGVGFLLGAKGPGGGEDGGNGEGGGSGVDEMAAADGRGWRGHGATEGRIDRSGNTQPFSVQWLRGMRLVSPWLILSSKM